MSPGRRIWLWPFSWMYLENLYVYKPGYDSHPPYMQIAWNDADKEKWKLKLNKLFPERKPGYYSIKDEEYFSDLRYVPGRYQSAYQVKCKTYKPTLIKLNRALSNEEKRRAKGYFSFSGMHCDYFKVKKFKELVEKGRRQ